MREQTRFTGVLVDSVSHQSLEGASIRLLSIHGPDMVQVAATLAKAGSRFAFAHVPRGRYRLSVTFQGNRLLWWPVTVTDDQAARSVFYLYPSSYEMEGLVITDTRPVRVHGDHARAVHPAGFYLSFVPGETTCVMNENRIFSCRRPYTLHHHETDTTHFVLSPGHPSLRAVLAPPP